MLCPICNVELMMTDRQGIEVDYCPKCRGIWLDRGELDKLVERSRSVMPDREEYRETQAYHAPPPPPRSHYDHAPPPRPHYDRYDDEHREHSGHHKHRRKKNFLEDIFDFD